MAKNDGGLAFPRIDAYAGIAGLTLRDYFAGMALQALISHGQAIPYHLLPDYGTWLEAAADIGYQFADAMLAERGKHGNK